MKVATKRLDFTYESHFARPAFEVATSTSAVLKVLYEVVNPRFPIDPSAIQVIPSNLLTDVTVRLGLLDKRLEIVLRPDRAVTRATGLAGGNAEGLEDFVTLVREAITKAAPESGMARTVFTFALWLTNRDTGTALTEFATKHLRPTAPLPLAALKGTHDSYALWSTVSNEAERWHMRVLLERSQLAGADLYFLFDFNFAAEGRYGVLSEQGTYMKMATAEVLNHFGLSIDDGKGATV